MGKKAEGEKEEKNPENISFLLNNKYYLDKVGGLHVVYLFCPLQKLLLPWAPAGKLH